MRLLIVGYCYRIRSERKLCQEVELHLPYRLVQHRTTFSAGRKRTASPWVVHPGQWHPWEKVRGEHELTVAATDRHTMVVELGNYAYICSLRGSKDL